MISMIERAARDPAIDVDKLERLIALQEKAQMRQAEQSFNAAMSEAQSEMGPIAADSNNPQTRSRYASYFALDKALRPIYSRHGFALSFGTGDTPMEQYIRVVCYASHRDGFTRTYHVDMPADGKGAKGGDVMTKTHAVGSGLTYGQRYLLKMIFNIAIGSDDDGNAASPTRVPSPPKEKTALQTALKHQKPHAIIPTENDSLQTWADRYLDALDGATSAEELSAWDALNDGPIATIRKKSPKLLKQIKDHFDGVKAALQRNSISTGSAQEVVPPAPTEFARPEGCPNAELEPDAFVSWASRKMARITTAEELDLIWENEIEPSMYGLFKPDCDSLQALYEDYKKKLGGD